MRTFLFYYFLASRWRICDVYYDGTVLALFQ